jgi:hypothetical protein
MGRSYFVPRSVKGESRLLYIFTIKSFISTAVFGLVGALIWYMGMVLFGMDPVAGLIITLVFGAVGFTIGSAKIPDVPFMGKFRKAGGEYLSDILFRFITFRLRKKIYVYNLNRGGNKK